MSDGHPWLASVLDLAMRPLYPARRLVVPEATGTVLEVGYTGNQGHKLERFRNYNMPLPGAGDVQARRPYPELGVVQMTDGVVSSNYHALAMRFQQRMGANLTTLVNVLFWLKMRYYQGPCIYPVALARALPKTEGGFYFLTQMLIHALHAGYSAVEVGLTHVERTSGRSKAVSFKNVLKALRAIARVWWAIHVKRDTVARRP